MNNIIENILNYEKENSSQLLKAQQDFEIQKKQIEEIFKKQIDDTKERLSINLEQNQEKWEKEARRGYDKAIDEVNQIFDTITQEEKKALVADTISVLYKEI